MDFTRLNGSQPSLNLSKGKLDLTKQAPALKNCVLGGVGIWPLLDLLQTLI